MSVTRFTLEGAERMQQIFRDFPELGYRKPVMEALRAAALPVRKAITDGIPSEIKPSRRILKIKSSRRGLVVTVGFHYGFGFYKSRRGTIWDAYQLVYWFNYGTYANRSPLHEFKHPRRRVSIDRRGGIKPSLFVEDAWERSKNTAARELERTWALKILELCDKYGATK